VPQVDRSLRRFAALVAGVLVLACAVVVSGASASSAPTTKQIQRALGIKADGAYGPQTRRAMKRFQRAHGLRVTGRPDEATLAALGITPAPTDRSFDSTSADAATILAQIAQCESGGDITAVSRDGRYFGKYQFSQATWESLGGVGNPAEADEPTQDAMAMKLYSQRGTAPWPACAPA
jgi:peptidoglycan hydrolase-like protein with peptidoglycan-binding domain